MRRFAQFDRMRAWQPFSERADEPPHVHVDRDDLSAKFWLNPVELARNFGFSAPELSKIESLLEKHQSGLLKAWNGYFGIDG